MLPHTLQRAANPPDAPNACVSYITHTWHSKAKRPRVGDADFPGLDGLVFTSDGFRRAPTFDSAPLARPPHCALRHAWDTRRARRLGSVSRLYALAYVNVLMLRKIPHRTSPPPLALGYACLRGASPSLPCPPHGLRLWYRGNSRTSYVKGSLMSRSTQTTVPFSPALVRASRIHKRRLQAASLPTPTGGLDISSRQTGRLQAAPLFRPVNRRHNHYGLPLWLQYPVIGGRSAPSDARTLARVSMALPSLPY